MFVILILIGVSLFVALIFLTAFVWANKSGQYDDAHTPAVRMLFDDQPANTSEIQSTPNKTTDHGRDRKV
jgi:cbb3-type cytochrome oxidase maturation protein